MHLSSECLKRAGKTPVPIRTSRSLQRVEIILPRVLPRPARRRLARVLSPQNGRLADRPSEARVRPGCWERVGKEVEAAGKKVPLRCAFDEPVLERPTANDSPEARFLAEFI